jgi:hypothetical protein
MATTLMISPGWDVRRADDPPYSYLERGAWPDGQLRDDAPPSAHIAQALARRLLDAMRESGLSDRAVAILAGCSHPTIGRILNGTGLTDVRTIFSLEVALQTSLWPHDLYSRFTLTIADEEVPSVNAAQRDDAGRRDRER